MSRNQLIGEHLPFFALADEMRYFYWSAGIFQSITQSINQTVNR